MFQKLNNSSNADEAFRGMKKVFLEMVAKSKVKDFAGNGNQRIVEKMIKYNIQLLMVQAKSDLFKTYSTKFT